MLYNDKLKELSPSVKEAVYELWQVAEKNQGNENDVLLVITNSFYDKSLDNEHVKSGLNLTPFVYNRQGWDAHADWTSYEFYDAYRQNLLHKSKAAFKASFTDPKEQVFNHKHSVNLSLMVYLKFWESLQHLRIMALLSKLAQGQVFPWEFDVTMKTKKSILIRDEISKALETICPKFHKLIDEVYLAQIRNAAAHSQFYLIDDVKMGFTNYRKGSLNILSQIDIEDWEDRFHKLILLQNHMIGAKNDYEEKYKAVQNGKEFGIKTIATHPNGKTLDLWLKFYEKDGQPRWMDYNAYANHFKGK